MIHGAGYGLAGVSGHAVAGTMALGDVNGLIRELYSEAIEKALKSLQSKSTNHIAKMQHFLKGHHKNAQPMGHLH